ncbi:FAD-dependent pyridine nucleotide-disulfide oxidoreductase [Streptomyces davaonensis JCM 4913]|uniref:FAD-dependent pyridine nucleotide-disulfide oxidoreductase n=1 Tax=Streptomyces davaonensis (strain DSM 101723 / JCM 4913 / KCC S-0913 / 768) TaxID=1214101 RepID=K4REM0_STRDJ|nr:FAD-dependent oxidoreductase [Streptomyces davaonensis]CCK31945.1 FAD-dependent pyridine nucleotide-disulfide oxidoreductase [Streptomyces davaonensis JCM 4913]
MTQHSHVVVIGGGYAGVMAANRLTQRADVTVTVINPRPAFVPRLRLHQLVGGTHEAVVDYREVLAERVRLAVDSVTRIDRDGRGVELSDGSVLGYDYLVYAVGSVGAAPRVPGAEFTHPVATLEAARKLRSVLDDTPATAAVTVVGGGPTGIETAGELAQQGRRVTLACGGVLGPYLHPRARRTAVKRLTGLGVTVLDGPGTKVTSVTRDAVRLADGRELPSEVTVWTAGFGVPELAARSGLSTDSAGRLLTDETLTSVDDERIIAAGDSAAPSGLPFRMSAYAAGCLGAHAADTVLNRLADRPAEPVDLSFPAMCISLGRGMGIFQFAHKNDTAMRLYVGGRAGARLKEMSCAFSVKHLVKEARKPGSHHWPKGEHRRQVLRAEQDKAPAA